MPPATVAPLQSLDGQTPPDRIVITGNEFLRGGDGTLTINSYNGTSLLGVGGLFDGSGGKTLFSDIPVHDPSPGSGYGPPMTPGEKLLTKSAEVALLVFGSLAGPEMGVLDGMAMAAPAMGATAPEVADVMVITAEGGSEQMLLGAGAKYDPWIGSISSEVTTAETTMFRVWGDGADQVGGWLTPTQPTSRLSAIRSLALPVDNSAQFVSKVTVPAGTRIQIGTAGPAFGQAGGASQVLLLDRIPSANFGPGVPLGPR